MQERPYCPRCGSVRVVKSGHARGKQRWLCRRCQYQFTRRDDHETPDEVKQAAVTLYGYGLSLNAVGRLLGSCAQSVMRWVCGYVDQHCPKPEPEPIPIIDPKGSAAKSTRCGIICTARKTAFGSGKHTTGPMTG